MRHQITNANPETKIGDCSVCGPNVRLKPRYGERAGTFRCLAKHKSTGGDATKFKDGTKIPRGIREKLLADCQGICVICKSQPATDLDHCHETKVIRGILCRSCNLGLGMFGDNIESLYSAIQYLSADY